MANKSALDARANKPAPTRNKTLDALMQALTDSVPPGSFGTGPDTYQRTYPAASELPGGHNLLADLLKPLQGTQTNVQSALDARVPMLKPETAAPAIDPTKLMSVEPAQPAAIDPLMSVDPSTLMSRAPAAAPVGSVEPMAAGSAPKSSSTARGAGERSAAANAAATVAQSTPGSTEGGDPIAARLKAQQAGAEGDRDAARGTAEEEKKLSDGEKVFMSMMAILPGLLGGIGGGALAGATGATAGMAGGLHGAAQGVGMVNEAKSQRVHDALAAADKAQGRADHMGDKLLGHEEKLGDQKFQAGQQKAGFDHADASQQVGFKHADAAQAAGFRHADKAQIQQMNHQMNLARENNAAQLAEARAKAEAKGPGEVKEFQSKAAIFAADIAKASDDIDKFAKGIEGSPMQSVIAGSTWGSLFKNKDTQRFAIAVAQLVNTYGHGKSGAAISEKEWDDAKVMFVPMVGDTAETLAMKRDYRIHAANSFYQQAGPAQYMTKELLQQHQNGDGPPLSQQPGTQQTSSSSDPYAGMKRVQ